MSPRELRAARPNRWRGVEMARVLGSLGYEVDAVSWKDTTFVPRARYDLFIGHANINFERIASHLDEDAAKLFFSTGCYWGFHNQEERKRYAALEQRRGVRLPFDRYIEHPEESALKMADGIIAMGNAHTKKTYTDAGFTNIEMYNNHVFRHDYTLDKDYDAGRQHFVYWAGTGPVHKGLDLTLEAFAGLEQHLWICTRLYPWFAREYEEELALPNVHAVGWIGRHTHTFREIMGRCNCVIMPSCSEGQATSMLEAMGIGLIPLASEATGIDDAIPLAPCTIEEIRRVIEEISSRPPEWHRGASAEAVRATRTKHSCERFASDFRNAVLELA